MKDHDTIIKWVGFVLSHLVEYPYLNTTRTRQTSPNWNLCPQLKKVMQIYMCVCVCVYIYIYKSRDFMWERIRFCQVNILCKENSNILKWHIKDKDKLNIYKCWKIEIFKEFFCFFVFLIFTVMRLIFWINIVSQVFFFFFWEECCFLRWCPSIALLCRC